MVLPFRPQVATWVGASEDLEVPAIAHFGGGLASTLRTLSSTAKQLEDRARNDAVKEAVGVA